MLKIAALAAAVLSAAPAAAEFRAADWAGLSDLTVAEARRADPSCGRELIQDPELGHMVDMGCTVELGSRGSVSVYPLRGEVILRSASRIGRGYVSFSLDGTVRSSRVWTNDYESRAMSESEIAEAVSAWRVGVMGPVQSRRVDQVVEGASELR